MASSAASPPLRSGSATSWLTLCTHSSGVPGGFGTYTWAPRAAVENRRETKAGRRIAPTIHQATGWFRRHPDTLKADEQQHLQTLTIACPTLATLRAHARAFAHVMLQLGGDRLEQWMKRVQAGQRMESVPEPVFSCAVLFLAPSGTEAKP